MMYHHPELTINNRRIISNHFPELQDKLGDKTFGTAWDKGKHMDIDDVVGQLRSAWT
jgi:hypothetical protein